MTTPTPSIHRLRRGLPGYLLLFAPHAFEPQRQLKPSRPPSPLVPLLIFTHFTATLGIPLSSPILQLHVGEFQPTIRTEIGFPVLLPLAGLRLIVPTIVARV